MILDDATIAELEKALPEAAREALVAKVREANKAAATALDGTKAEQATATKAAKEAAALAKKYQGELEAARKGDDSARQALIAERDAALAERAKLEGEHRGLRVRTALADRLGITDAVKRSDALTLLGSAGVELDEQGNLVGADAAVAELKKTRPWLFDAPAAGNGGPRAGADPNPRSGPGKPKTLQEEVAAERARLYPSKKGAAGAATH